MLSLSWWFQLVPVWSAWSLRVLFSVSLVLLIVGGIARFLAHRRLRVESARTVADRLTLCFIVMGGALLVYWFMAFEMIALLSARFWSVCLVIGGALWLFSIVRAVRAVPAQVRNNTVREESKKYFRMRS
jgi:hypothetical protein